MAIDASMAERLRPMLNVVAAAGFDPPGLAELRHVHLKYPMGSRERMVAAEPHVRLLMAYFDKNLNGMVVNTAGVFLKTMGKDTRPLQNLREHMASIRASMAQPAYAARIYNRLPAIVAKYPPGQSLSMLGDPDFYAMVKP